MKTPSPRVQARRRRWAVLAALSSLALASGLIGWFASPRVQATQGAVTGPLSYIPAS